MFILYTDECHWVQPHWLLHRQLQDSEVCQDGYVCSPQLWTRTIGIGFTCLILTRFGPLVTSRADRLVLLVGLIQGIRYLKSKFSTNWFDLLNVHRINVVYKWLKCSSSCSRVSITRHPAPRGAATRPGYTCDPTPGGAVTRPGSIQLSCDSFQLCRSSSPCCCCYEKGSHLLFVFHFFLFPSAAMPPLALGRTSAILATSTKPVLGHNL